VVASGNFKIVPTEDKKYENDNPHVQKQVKAAKAEAQRRTRESKDKDYYARVDGKNKTVTVEESNRPKGYGSYLFRDVILNPLQSGNNFFNAGKSLLSGDLGGAFKNTVTGVGNLFSPFTLGIGSWAGDNYARFKPEEVQYGTREEVLKRKQTENLLVSTPIDMAVGHVTSKIPIKKIIPTKSKNPVTQMTAAESRAARQGAIVLEEGADGVLQFPKNAAKSPKNIPKSLPHTTASSTTEAISYTRNVERIAQTTGSAAKNLKTPVIEYKAPSKPTVIEEAGSKGGMKLKLNLQLFASKNPVIRIDELNQAIDNRGSGYFQKLQNSKQYGYTPSDEYYANLRADRNVGNVTAPIDFDNHVISGEINSRGKGVGGHSSLTPTVRIDMDLGVTSNGVRKNNISIFDIENNQWVQKTYRRGEPALNTMFPEWWTGNRIKVENNAAYINRTSVITPNGAQMWEGVTPSGIKVKGYEPTNSNPNATVYPKQNQ
ncbi:EndoU domain-containing protein, partial [Leptotrichia trevisanii]